MNLKVFLMLWWLKNEWFQRKQRYTSMRTVRESKDLKVKVISFFVKILEWTMVYILPLLLWLTVIPMIFYFGFFVCTYMETPQGIEDMKVLVDFLSNLYIGCLLYIDAYILYLIFGLLFIIGYWLYFEEHNEKTVLMVLLSISLMVIYLMYLSIDFISLDSLALALYANEVDDELVHHFFGLLAENNPQCIEVMKDIIDDCGEINVFKEYAVDFLYRGMDFYENSSLDILTLCTNYINHVASFYEGVLDSHEVNGLFEMTGVEVAKHNYIGDALNYFVEIYGNYIDNSEINSDPLVPHFENMQVSYHNFEKVLYATGQHLGIVEAAVNEQVANTAASTTDILETVVENPVNEQVVENIIEVSSDSSDAAIESANPANNQTFDLRALGLDGTIEIDVPKQAVDPFWWWLGVALVSYVVIKGVVVLVYYYTKEELESYPGPQVTDLQNSSLPQEVVDLEPVTTEVINSDVEVVDGSLEIAELPLDDFASKTVESASIYDSYLWISLFFTLLLVAVVIYRFYKK